MSFGYGMLHFKSRKKKLITKSSTEAKLAVVGDYLTYNSWICFLIVAQRYEIKQNILFQDNQSTIKMGKTGQEYCTENSRHIDICYFFAKERVESNNIS